MNEHLNFINYEKADILGVGYGLVNYSIHVFNAAIIMITEIIYAIILAVVVISSLVISCILVNRKERNEAKNETTRNYRNLNN